MMNESREFEVELELKARVTMQDIDDIMCTALDGGITGWCRAAKPVFLFCHYSSPPPPFSRTPSLTDGERNDFNFSSITRGFSPA